MLRASEKDLPVPNVHHHNSLSIITRGFWGSEKFLIVQTPQQYKTRAADCTLNKAEMSKIGVLESYLLQSIVVCKAK